MEEEWQEGVEGCEEMKEWEEGGMRAKQEGNGEGRRGQKRWGEKGQRRREGGL